MEYIKRYEGIVPMEVSQHELTIPFEGLPCEMVEDIKKGYIEELDAFVNVEEGFICVHTTCIQRAD